MITNGVQAGANTALGLLNQGGKATQTQGTAGTKAAAA